MVTGTMFHFSSINSMQAGCRGVGTEGNESLQSHLRILFFCTEKVDDMQNADWQK